MKQVLYLFLSTSFHLEQVLEHMAISKTTNMIKQRSLNGSNHQVQTLFVRACINMYLSRWKTVIGKKP